MIGIRSGGGGGGVASIGNSPSRAISTVLCVGFGGAVACLGLMLGVIVSRAYFGVTVMAACVLLLLLCCRAREACQLRRYALPPEPPPPQPRAPSVSRDLSTAHDRVVPLACIPSGALCSDSASALPARNAIH
ncbi:hypothetical protein HPB50_011000 [Hyalomma asiaticum]|uniref:Uncharacterized protein n=1 Tax=Hyalomma asiaticum TaxID=266040 RepID=A0ACB7TFP3_HYAAI|nr:hypothetical protein HPB50_011000 [Hyalomma asiaticum]